MKTHASKQVKGIFTTLSLLVGTWLLNSCATEKVESELARGTHWREAATVVGQPKVLFSYQMNGRKYDRVTFGNWIGCPVVLENGRVFAVVNQQGNKEWNRRLSDCRDSGDLPFENGLGPLHSLVVEQGKQFQRNGWPREPEPERHMNAAAMVALTPLALAGAPLFALTYGSGLLMAAPVFVLTSKSRQKSQELSNALLDSGVSYAAFLSALGEPKTETSKGSYSIKTYPSPLESLGFTSLCYVGVNNGKVVWVSDEEVGFGFMKLYEYRKSHGLQ